MKTTYKVRTDAFTDGAKPAKNHGDAAVLQASSTDPKYIWIFVPLPKLDPDAIVTSALLNLRFSAALAGGPHVFTARNIIERWTENGIKHNDMPDVDLVGPSANASVTSAAIDSLLSFNITTQIQEAISNGAPFFGIRIEKASAALAKLYSAEHKEVKFRPVFETEVNLNPESAANLQPSGDKAISVLRHLATWRFIDPEKEDVQSEFWYRVATNPTVDATGMLTTSVHYNSGWVVSGKNQLDTAATAMAALADNTTFYHQVKNRDNRGGESPWSEVRSFRRVSKGVLSITVPAADGAAVEDTSPTVTYNNSVRGISLVQHELWLDGTTPETGRLLWQSPWMANVVAAGVATSFDIPEGLIRLNGRDYYVKVRIYDPVVRQERPGDPATQEATRRFLFVRSGTPAPTTDLVVSMSQRTKINLAWQRATLPTAFAIARNGEIIEDKILAADAHDGGTNYSYSLYEGVPGKESEWEVIAIETIGGIDRYSQANDTQDFRIDISGVWLVIPALDLECPILGPINWGLKIMGSGALHEKIGSRLPSYLFGAVGGYGGTIQGALIEQDDLDVRTQVDRWERVIGLRNTRTMRLIYHQHNYSVILTGLPAINPTEVDEIYTLDVSLAQVGDWTFDVVGL